MALVLLGLLALPAWAQVGAGTAPNLTTLYGQRITTQRQQFDYTGADQVITAPANAIGVYFKVWGAGGGHEIVQDSAKAGAGGYTGALFNTAPGTQYTLMVGGGGNGVARIGGVTNGVPNLASAYGFGGLAEHDQGGGLSGVFSGATTVVRTDRARALAVAGGGGGSDNDALGNQAGGSNGNGANSGYGTLPGTLNWNYAPPSITGRSAGATISGTMQGSTDAITDPVTGAAGGSDPQAACFDVEKPTVWQSGGGGGYEGGGRGTYTRSNSNTAGFGAAERCGIDAQSSGRGGSGFVHGSNRFQSIESTAEIAAGNDNNVNLAPRSGGGVDTDYSAAGQVARGGTVVPIGRAGNRSNFVYSAAVNGGGDGRIVVYWVVAAPVVSVQKLTPNGVGGPFAFADTNLTGNVANITTATANTATPAAPTALTVTNPAQAVTLTETAAAGFASTGVACNDGNSALSGNTNPVATSTNNLVTIPAAVLTARAADIVCVFTNTQNADLSVAKTNTSASGPSDLANDTVTAGAVVTYQLRVTNSGPGSATGAVVRDTPGAGLTCAGTNPVTITGSGVPAGSFTVANLTGASGIVLGQLNAGQNVTLSYNCTVN